MSSESTIQTLSSPQGMRDSVPEYIGTIPTDWSITRLKYLANIYNGSTPKSDRSSYWDGDIAWVTPADMSEGSKYIFSGKKSITQEGFDSCNLTLMHKDDIVMSTRAPIGTICMVGSDLCTNQGCKSLSVRDGVDSSFIYYYLKAVKNYLVSLGNGTTFFELSTSDLANVAVPLPSLVIQKKIACHLDTLVQQYNSIIASQQEMMSKLEEYKRSVIYYSITKGLDRNATMKESGISWAPLIPSHWKISKVKYEYCFHTGGTPSSNIDSYYDGELKWATIADLKSKEVSDTINHLSNEGLVATSIPISPKGSLMFSFKLSVGAVSFCSSDMYTNEAIATFTDNEKNDLGFLYYAAPIEVVQNCNENIYGAQLLNQDLIKNATIILPPYDEQKKIATFLDSYMGNIVDPLIERCKSSIISIKEMKNSTIYEYVTGKKQVPQEVMA